MSTTVFMKRNGLLQLMLQVIDMIGLMGGANSTTSVLCCYKSSGTGAFSSMEKTGRGSHSFVGSGASSSYSPCCKYRKEVMRQR